MFKKFRSKETAPHTERRREFDFNGRELTDILLDHCRENGHTISARSERWINGLASDAGGVRIVVIGD